MSLRQPLRQTLVERRQSYGAINVTKTCCNYRRLQLVEKWRVNELFDRHFFGGGRAVVVMRRIDSQGRKRRGSGGLRQPVAVTVSRAAAAATLANYRRLVS